MRTKAKIVAVVAAACLLVGGLGVAHAAQLSVTSGGVSTATAQACTGTTPVRVTRQGGLWRTIAFTLPEPCWGKQIDAMSDPLIFATSTKTIANGTPNGQVSITFDSFSLSSTVVVLVDGWRIPITVV